MQNKGYSHPFGGSTLIPGAMITNGGGRPIGSPSVIPGTIGAAGAPSVQFVDEKPKEAPSSIATLVDGFFEALGDKIAERVTEKVMQRFAGAEPQLDHLSTAELQARTFQMQELYFKRLRDERQNTQLNQTLSQAIAASVRLPEPQAQYIEHEGQIKPAVPVSETMPLEQIEAYSKAHHELALKLAEIPSVNMVRLPPSPLGFRLGDPRHDSKASEWTVYAAAYNNPRFPVHADAGRYMALRNGIRLRASELPCAALTEWTAVCNELHALWDQPDVASETYEALSKRCAELHSQLDHGIGLTLDQVLEAVRAELASA